MRFIKYASFLKKMRFSVPGYENYSKTFLLFYRKIMENAREKSREPYLKAHKFLRNGLDYGFFDAF